MDHDETKYSYGQDKSTTIPGAHEKIQQNLRERSQDDISLAITENTDNQSLGVNENVTLKDDECETELKYVKKEYTDARPKKIFKDPATSSGISSLSFCLPDKEEGPMMKEFLESTRENTVPGQFASSK